jgi:uncharacterized membrane protein YbhN (UPF0104 family)
MSAYAEEAAAAAYEKSTGPQLTTDSGRQRPRRRWLRAGAIAALIALFGTELALGWPSLAAAVSQLRAPNPAWLAAAVLAETASMRCYARMQRRLLRSAGVRVSIVRHIALAYAAHSLSVTLPGGPAFSTQLNYRQMRRFGASPAVASWCIALSGILSAGALGILTAVGALAAHNTPPWRTLLALAVAAVVITLGIRQISRHPRTLRELTRVVLQQVNRLRRRPATAGLDEISGFVSQLRAARLTPGNGAVAAAFAVLNWALDALCLWLCYHTITGDTISVTLLLLAFCAGMAAGSLTIIPAGLGIIDSALILGLVSGGVPTAAAIAVVVSP